MTREEKPRNNFKDIEEASAYFKEIYSALPESVIKDVIEFCMKNPNRFPDNHKDIDISNPPLPKKETEKIIEGAVEIFDDPNDPNLSIIKHKEGASVLSREEADELQEKINKALEEQKESDIRDYQEKYEKHNKALLKAKLKEAKNRVARK
jgi:hypothetical protein